MSVTRPAMVQSGWNVLAPITIFFCDKSELHTFVRQVHQSSLALLFGAVLTAVRFALLFGAVLTAVRFGLLFARIDYEMVAPGGHFGSSPAVFELCVRQFYLWIVG